MFGKYVLTITHAPTVSHAGKFIYSSQGPTILRYSLCVWHESFIMSISGMTS